MSGYMSTRSKGAAGARAPTRFRHGMPLDEEIRAIEEEARRETLRKHAAAQRAARRAMVKAAEKATSQKTGVARRESSPYQAPPAPVPQRNHTPAEEPEPLEQSFDFDLVDLTAADISSDENSMDLDPSPPADPYADTILARLQTSSAELDPHHTLTFPFNRVFPKACVFLQCREAHVFALPQTFDSNLLSPIVEDSHAMAQVMGPCPQCVPDKATTAEAFCSRKCAFCMVTMSLLPSGRYACLTQPCWFARCGFQNGSPVATAVWKEVWRLMDKRYFFVGKVDEVLSYSNDLDRDGAASQGGYAYTV